MCRCWRGAFLARKRPVGGSWPMDKAYILIKGTYLYRAVDKAGATIDFFLTARRDHVAALRFLRKVGRLAWRSSEDHHRHEQRQHSGDRKLQYRT